MFECNSRQFYSYSWSGYIAAVEWIATVVELPAILDRFYWLCQHHKHTYRSEGWWGATKWWVSPSGKLKTTKWHQLVLFSALCNRQNSYIYGQSHQPVMWWFMASCLLVQGRWSHSKITWALVRIWQTSETGHSKSSLVALIPEMLVSMYSYHVMVKRVNVYLIIVFLAAGFPQIQSHISVF